MATTYDKASLVMIPSGYKDDKLYSIKPTDGSGDFTFSRDGAGASPATRVNASGLIEKGRTNELLQSNTFDNASWTKTRATLTGGQSGYDGSSDAWAFVDDTNNSTHLLYQPLSSLGAEVATMSVYAKSGAVNFIAFRFEGAAVDYAYFDLANGTLGTIDSDYIEARITDVGGGWYRCEATRVLAASGNQAIILPAQTDNDPTYAGAGTTAIYIQDAQVELGLIATSVIETTTTAVSAGLLGDMPRLDYSGGATCPSLLLEPSRVNNIAQSEFQGSGSIWYPSTTWSVEQNTSDTTSPENVYNAVKLTETATFGFHSGYYNAGIASSYTGNYTISCFAKYNGRFLVLSPKSASERTYFNLQTGVVAQNGTGSFVDADIEDYGNGWYRCWVTASFSSESVNFEHLLANAVGSLQYTGDGTSGVYMYGCQAESGSYPTSYIPTYGSASTRGLEYYANNSASSIIGQTEGTLFIEFTPNTDIVSTKWLSFLGSGSDYVGIYILNTSSKIRLEVAATANQATFDTASAVVKGQTYKCAIAYANNDFVAYVNGVQVGTDTSGSVPATSTIRSYYNLSSIDSTDTKQLALFPTRLTNAELATLTTL